MCGFLSYFSGDSTIPPENRLNSALDELVHRGPDDRHTAAGEGWWLGFCRLAIQDLSSSGRQPMSFGAGRYQLVYNGEIYNQNELRRKYVLPASVSNGDTALLGTLLERKGVVATMAELRGMFAFVWWDTHEQTATMARDPFGIKPLYYCRDNPVCLVAGSEIRAIKSLSGNNEVSFSAVSSYLRWGSIEEPETILRGIESLPTGTYGVWKSGKLQIHDLELNDRDQKISKIDCPELCRERVENAVRESVKAHMISDVPVGLFLSGGLDSTILCGLMAEMGEGPVKAYSIGFDSDSLVSDESDIAKRTADFYGASFERNIVSADNFFDQFDDYIEGLDQPTGDAINVHLVAQMAAKQIKVVLSGTGADEIFGGYKAYQLIRMASSLGLSRRIAGRTMQRAWQSLPAGLQANKYVRSAGYFLGGAGRTVDEIMAYTRGITPRRTVERLMMASEVAREAKSIMGSDAAENLTMVEECLLHDTRHYLKNTLLRDGDSMTMAHSLEMRTPFVDREVFEIARSVDISQNIRGFQGKIVLRQAFSDLLPSWIFEDRKKKTFSVPLMKWLAGDPWRTRIIETLESGRFRERGWFDPVIVKEILDDYMNLRNRGKSSFRICQRVWLLFVLESWVRVHIDQSRPTSV